MSTTDAETQPAVDTPASKQPMSLRNRIIAALATCAVLGGGGFAATQLGGSGASTGMNRGPGGGPPGGMGQGPATGTITAVSARSISVKASSGTVTTYAISSATRVMDDGSASTVSGLAVGDTVAVLSGRPGATTTSGAADVILAGTSATQGPGGAGGAPPAGAPGAAAGTST